MTEKLIEFKNVTFEYPGDAGSPAVSVLKNINLTISEGEFVAVVGCNGSGKSTLAKHMNAILLPSSGKVTVDGDDTADEEKLYDIRQKVGMVFQNPDNQIVATVVEEDVAFGLENIGVPPAEIRERVDSSLAAVGLTKHKDDQPHRLSGGQKQRVAIAGIIAMSPRCIVLDEPTAMLDPKGRAMVIDTVKRLNRERGITVVLITHYMDEAARADRVVVLSGGRIAMDAAPKKVFGDAKAIKSFGLELPDTTALCCLLHDAGVPIDADIVSPDECVEKLVSLLEKAKKAD